ncbi:hypothetical protein NOR_01973 [Metarhizium rileyi]|uniref:Histidine kinase group protein n=1 Tax=Metarhizium rileyi (strain RCEF 4871) TaxID=1649241 RepID=A0A167I6H8_METRR|nr:hypothetical protein NOR_01973 [Metarhizium rileyi RCEF 4871]
MAKLPGKGRLPTDIESESDGGSASPTKEIGAPADKFPPSPAPSAKKSSGVGRDTATASPSTALIICRNKHWRYISSFHGPWLQLPTEILDIIANINYNAPRPRPVDPAVVFDVLKIRKAVDEATAFAVGAANDLAPSTLVNVNGGTPNFNPLSHGTKLSKERKLRMRELACQKLARAYRLDEIACSVATMQSTSALEEVGGLVLQRNPDDLTAKYVHFFHEKIPSKQLVETTSLQPLTDIIESAHGQAEALRTRATVKVFQGQFEGAAQDLTDALALPRHHVESHGHDQSDLGRGQSQSGSGRRNQDIVLQEKDQPSGLVAQLLFQRASVYTFMACRHVEHSIRPQSPKIKPPAASGHPDATIEGGDETQSVPSDQLESRKLVKNLAKRALKDYMSFLSYFDYSPNLPKATVFEFSDRVTHAANGVRKPPRSFEPDSASEQHTVYPLSDLFAAIPPPHLPPYPPQESEVKNEVKRASQSCPEPNTSEMVTYHPLLTEALHALLLCHCLVQTSVKELQRHAYMVARLVRLCDGFPVFHASRSPARSDWVEILRRTKNWLPLGSTWAMLCAPVSLTDNDAVDSLSSAAASLLKETTPGPSSPGDRKRKSSEKPSHMDDGDPPRGPASVPSPRSSFKYDPFPHWNADEERKEYPFLTERTTAIVRWISEVPVVTGAAKRKKRPRKAGAIAETVEVDLSSLTLNK